MIADFYFIYLFSVSWVLVWTRLQRIIVLSIKKQLRNYFRDHRGIRSRVSLGVELDERERVKW